MFLPYAIPPWIKTHTQWLYKWIYAVPTVWKQTCLESHPRLFFLFFLVIKQYTTFIVYGTRILFDILYATTCLWAGFLIVQGKITVDFVPMYSLWEPHPLYCLCVTTRDRPEQAGTKWDRGGLVEGWASNGTWKTHLEWGWRVGGWRWVAGTTEGWGMGGSKHGDRWWGAAGNYHVLLKEGKKARREEMEAAAKRRETSNKVKVALLPLYNVFDKLSCKGKNKQSCTV